MNQGQIRQNSACSTTATTQGVANDENCQPGTYYYVNYGQIVTSPNPADQQSALTNPGTNCRTRLAQCKSTTIPTQIPVGTLTCVAVNAIPGGCPNNSSNFLRVGVQHDREQPDDLRWGSTSIIEGRLVTGG